MKKPLVLLGLAASVASADSDPNFWWLDEGAFQSAVISTTSHYRGEYGAGFIMWNATLAAFASWYLNNYNCAFQHSGGPFGENMAFGYQTPAVSVAAWGNEAVQYDYGHPGYSPATGHFTQLVWKATTDVGCARRCLRRMLGGLGGGGDLPWEEQVDATRLHDYAVSPGRLEFGLQMI
ncbi:SCP-like extracellular protein [Ophiocordyceps camponoti-floridani]|uniref:SCP-like extracellular protein n=1 Tax=Ophiocordyceps camponoti-floridani TaxID=2030778 RepID=A0A8H4VEY1_9HYPO|nr:SCP-like extracellular protein [Ophiocordyceps camponoti-floridani]